MAGRRWLAMTGADLTIYYIRHGQTDWNAKLRFQGRRDIELNSLGRRQASRNGRKLCKLIGSGDDLLFLSSPLARARETMEILLAELNRDPCRYVIAPELIEACYGELEGVTLAEFKSREPEAHARRKRERWTFCPPGGESHEMVARRVGKWLDGLQQDAVISGHGVVGRVLRQHLLGLPPDEAADYPFPQDVVSIWRNGREKLV